MATIRQILKTAEAVVITGATRVFPALDMTNHKSASCQVFTAGGGLTGTAKLVQSNDGVNWTDFPAAQYPNASKAVASNGSVQLEAQEVTAGFVGLSVQISAGNASTSYIMLGKER